MKGRPIKPGRDQKARRPRSPKITLAFDSHEDYVGWVQDHRDKGAEAGARRAALGIRGNMMAIDAAQAEAVAEALSLGLLEGWAGESKERALLLLGVAVGVINAEDVKEVLGDG